MLVRRLFALPLACAVVATTFVVAAASVGAATVPNVMACTRNGGHCFQVNGGHVSGIPYECFWTNRTGRDTIYYTQCNYWIATPPGWQ